jgi:flagellar protein FlgJ
MIADNSLAIDVNSAQSLKVSVASGDQQAMRVAARKFEALMVGMMLKNMRETRFSEEDDPMTGGEGVKLYSELLDQQWAEQIAKGRGLGFADMIVKAYAPHPSPPGGGAGGEGTTPAQATTPTSPTPATTPTPPTSPTTASPPATSTTPRAPPPEAALTDKQSFLETLRPHAEVAEAATGVPADFILAHAALESGWGARQITAADGTPSHNLFGIKGGRGWQGASVTATTTEYSQGLPIKQSQPFRAYANYAEAFTDYARLIQSRYTGAAGKDADRFAQALASGGYASDPAYAAKLKSVIASVAPTGA